MTTDRMILSDEERAAFRALGFARPPTAHDLPETDGLPMDHELQALQMDLSFETLRLHFAGRRVHVGKNQIIYYSADQVRRRDFLGPDVYVVLDADSYPRPSWVIWDEGKAPEVVLEVLSESTHRRDRGEKKRIYQDDIGVEEYFWYDPLTGELAGFRRRDGRYEPLAPDAAGRLPCAVLGLTLVIWEGTYQGVHGRWLRWATAEGVLLPTREEAERQRADQERTRADQARREGEVQRSLAEQERTRADDTARRLAEARQMLERYRERFGEPPGAE